MKNVKKVISKVLAVLMFLTVLAVPFASQADAATVPSYLPIKGYTRYTSNVYTYSSINGSRTGYIAPNDYITINNVYSNGWSRVTYPISGGRYKTAYCKSIALFVNPDFSTAKGYFGVSKAVYSKPNLNKKIGTVYANDHVMIVGTVGNTTQIIYPISGGYKTGFVNGSYCIDGGNNNNNNNYSSVYLNVPNYKQYDSRWAYTKLGNTSKTIKSKGCTTTCMAMSESYLQGRTIYPNTIARTYRYTSGASMYWPSNYTVSNTSNYMNTIYNQLKRGRPVLVGAKTSGGSQHWVLVTGYNGKGVNNKSNYTIHDPNSSSRTNLQQFFNKYTRYYKIAYRK